MTPRISMLRLDMLTSVELTACFITVPDIIQWRRKDCSAYWLPPADGIAGRVIGQYASAVAFSPAPDNTASAVRGSGESWWDRLFPWRHMHLHSVQLPVTISQGELSAIHARLTICTQLESMQCVATTDIQVEPDTLDDQDGPNMMGVLEWYPDETIVLKKKQIYWLILENSGKQAFEWIYADPISTVVGDRGVAHETSNGWQIEQDGGPGADIPSIIVGVVAHK
ncbi:hypothetical protein BCR43DRAFT_542514 [Syncephalastrum racemosum]|uniref:Uncharacterized protein n=1 Tax=Syncephalastrum racemosum TaxID=13706 RepID=A0A1X2HQ50_SYNRA|nr:hypothetical protein BCR43DRAFT_542514 [Syncephalastrum racemosum]